MTNWINVVLTFFVIIITYLVLKVYLKIAWFTGSMESHSEVMLRIEAKRGINHQPIKLMWWDPTIAPPPVKREHGQEEVDLSTVYMYLPLDQRRNNPTWWMKMKDLLHFP